MNKKLVVSLLLLCLALSTTVYAKEKTSKPKKNKVKTTKIIEQKAEAGIDTTDTKSTEQTPATQTVEQTKPVEAKLPYILADDNLSNLQVRDGVTPVFDKYTIQERRALGLPTYLPQLTAPSGKIAYLTFDDGPENKNTLGALDVLKQYGIKATFYLVGRYCTYYPEVVKRIFDEGHAIGNHSYTHDYDVLYPNVYNFMDEIYNTEKVIKEIIGVRPLIIRAPGGKAGMFTNEYYPVLASAGLVEHDWNVCIEDATSKTYYAEDFINKVRQQTAWNPQHAIVLMHCGAYKGETIRALPGIIQVLKDRGYSFGVITPATPQPW